MGKLISQRAFALTAGVSAAAVRHALAVGRLVETDNGMDIADEVNQLYLDEHQEKLIEGIEETGVVPLGWSALCIMEGNRRIPLLYYPPHGCTNGIPREGMEGYAVKHKPHLHATDTEGRTYKLALVYDKHSPPPWLYPRKPGRRPTKVHA